MKQTDLLPRIEGGDLILVATYHSGKVDAVQMRAREGGGRRTGYVVRETVLTPKEALAVTRWLRDEEKHEDWKPSAKPGSKVTVSVTGMEISMGTKTLQGVIEPLV